MLPSECSVFFLIKKVSILMHENEIKCCVQKYEVKKIIQNVSLWTIFDIEFKFYCHMLFIY